MSAVKWSSSMFPSQMRREPSLDRCCWKAAGLRHPSTVRVSKLLAIDKRIIKQPLGKIGVDDLAAVTRALGAALGIA